MNTCCFIHDTHTHINVARGSWALALPSTGRSMLERSGKVLFWGLETKFVTSTIMPRGHLYAACPPRVLSGIFFLRFCRENIFFPPIKNAHNKTEQMSWAIHASLETEVRETNTGDEHLLCASVESTKKNSKACLPKQLPPHLSPETRLESAWVWKPSVMF